MLLDSPLVDHRRLRSLIIRTCRQECGWCSRRSVVVVVVAQCHH